MELYNIYNENNMKYPIIINLPHSGTKIPNEIRKKFVSPAPILANTDWFLNELFSFLIEKELTILSANYSRYVVDLNRIITDPIIGDNYNKCTIYGKTTWKKDLYKQYPTQEECKKRIKEYYEPYHLKLQELINNKLKKFKKVLILDLHSGYSSTGDKDICLGTANNTMCDISLVQDLKEALENVGYTVNLNNPMTGGKVLRKYHEENNNVQCILFEINYKKYIKEEYSGEEELTKYNKLLFENAKCILEKAFTEYLVKLM